MDIVSASPAAGRPQKPQTSPAALFAYAIPSVPHERYRVTLNAMSGLNLYQFYRMWRDPWRSSKDLIEMQNRRLRRLVVRLYGSHAWYRDALDRHGVKPEDIQGTQHLSRLPILTKQQLQKVNRNGILSPRPDASRLSITRTSGSSGTPLQMVLRKKNCARLNKNWVRPLLAYGVRPWSHRFEVSGPHNIPQHRKWYQHLGLWRITGRSIFDSPANWIDGWFAEKPDYLYGYSGSLALMAREVLNRGIQGIHPRAVFGVSDLVGSHERNIIEQAFGSPLIDLYGAAEAGCIAWECHRCGAYHINADTVIVEFLRDGRPVPPGSPGKVVITNLYSDLMPIVRYDLGDVGTSSTKPSECGRGLPLMEIVEGRADAFLTLPSGRILSPMFWFGIMKPILGITKWRVIQQDIGRIRILIQPDSGFTPGTGEQILQRFKAGVPEVVRIEIQRVEDIPPDPSGKVRAVISHLPSPF